MGDTRTVKLFSNGNSQAVRLPADFRFEGSEIYATRDPLTGDVILSRHPGQRAWSEFFDLVHSIVDNDAYMAERPMNVPVHAAGVFDDELLAPARRRG